jgi:hypothetical protein
MDPAFRSHFEHDLFRLVEDAILSGSFDELVLERAAVMRGCRGLRPFVRRRRGYDRPDWN